MDLIRLEQFIISQGWSFFGVADFKSVQEKICTHRKIFDEWVKKGFHAGMDYLPRMAEDRHQPDRKLPEAKSAIILAAWYSNELGARSLELGAKPSSKKNSLLAAPSSQLPARGVVARYAAGRDYHKVLRKKLIELSDWLKLNDPTAQTYVSVDSGPLADRVLAEAAGLGFFGNNACLINPSKGSYFFIASFLTTLALEPSITKPMPNCGDCKKCKIACPTGALKGGGVIDANRCISYLTIENKGPIPIEFRQAMGNRIFGCDACQEVCPFNVGRAHSQEIRINDLKSENGVGESLDLAEVLSIRTDDGFLKRFAGTPLMRAKRFGLVRNACVVAGNSGDRTLVPILQQLIENESDGILKEHAKWALSQLS